MATTGSNFVYQTATTLNGTAVTTAPYLDLAGPKEAVAESQPTQPKGGSGSPIASTAAVVDRVTVDLSLTSTPVIGTPPAVPECYGTYIGNFAKNGGVLLSLSGSTPQSIDFTNTTANTPASTAGDTAFSNLNVLVIQNLGTTDVVLSPGASNPNRLPTMTGTSPTIDLPAGSTQVFNNAAGLAVDSTHKILTFTPSSGGTISVSAGGS